MLEEDQLNKEATLKLAEDKIFANCKKWCLDNGAIVQGIQFPAAFGVLGVRGVAASEDISPNTVVMAIPNKLLISEDKVLASELSPIFKQHPELFDDKFCGVAEFNSIGLFLMYEKLKGDKSFWHPYLDLIQQSYILTDWSSEELSQLEDDYLVKEVESLGNCIEKQWLKIHKVMSDYPNYFDLAKVDRNLFFFCYEIPITRGFGSNVPSMCLVPLVDMFNHHCDPSTNHFLVNTRFESDTEHAHAEYSIKKEKINLELFKDKALTFSKEEVESKGMFKYQSNRIEYVRQNKQYLSQKSQTAIQEENIEQMDRHTLKDLCAEINLQKIKSTQEKDLFRYEVFNTTASENNDSYDEEGTAKKIKKEKMKSEELDKLSQNNLADNPRKQLKKQWKEDEFIENEEQNCETKESEIGVIKKETKFSWFDNIDEANYFVISTKNAKKKDQQLHICYGKRPNRYLLKWYSFAFQDNKYDSFHFRLRTNVEPEEPNAALFEKIVFEEYQQDQACSGGLEWRKQLNYNTTNLTFEFRLQKNKICLDLIIHLREYLMKYYQEKEQSSQEIIASLPITLSYELFVLSFAIKLLKYIRLRFKTSVEEDKSILEDTTISYKKRFVVIYKLNQKLILDEQTKLFSQAIVLLEKLDEKTPLIESIMHWKQGQGEDQERAVYLQQWKLKPYIQQIQESIKLGIFQWPKGENKLIHS